MMYPLSLYLTITQGFHSNHKGVDFGWNNTLAPGSKNQAILAAEGGTVIDLADGWGNTYPYNRVYGNFVIIDHGNKVYTVYGHLSKGLLVSKGQKVKKGQAVGYMGNTGYSDGEHLHFELRKGGNSKTYSVDPLDDLYVENDIIISPNTLYPNRIKKGSANVGTPVERNTNAEQVEVLVSGLRARKRPELNDAVILGFINKGIYNILDARDMTAEASNGYLWYMVEENVWVAFSDDWAIVHEAEENAECAECAELEALAKEYEAKWKEAAAEADAAKVHADILLTIIAEAEAVLRKAD